MRATGPTGEPVDTALARARRGRGGRDGRRLRAAAAAAGPARAAHRDAPTARARSSRAALDRGCRSVVLGIGGSASTDGGAGMLEALGARLLDAAGTTLPRGGGALADLRPRRPVRPAPGRWPPPGSSWPATSTTRCSARTAPPRCTGRRRARPRTTSRARRRRWRTGRTCVDAATGRTDVRDRPGAGAAGGVGYAAMAVLGAELRAGDRAGARPRPASPTTLPGAPLVITGEGSLDEQTLHGKAPAGVAAAAAKAGIPVVTVSGRLALDRATSCTRPGSPRPTP